MPARGLIVPLFGAAALLAGCPSGGADDILTSGEKLYSQHDEELVIRHFFGDRREGFFVDVGAYHWKDASTTYYLEAHLGWSGIAIDALDQFREGYEQNRSRTRFLNYIVTDHSGTFDTLYVAGPLSSVDESHVDGVVAALKDRGRDVKTKEDPNAPGFDLREIRVRTITLTELLIQQGVSKIDLLSMDIEGGEPAALAGFDIERFAPELVCIEAMPSARDELRAYFDAHGYERIERYDEYDEVNWYFRPKAGAE